jgi:hypothetical protein
MAWWHSEMGTFGKCPGEAAETGLVTNHLHEVQGVVINTVDVCRPGGARLARRARTDLEYERCCWFPIRR